MSFLSAARNRDRLKKPDRRQFLQYLAGSTAAGIIGCSHPDFNLCQTSGTPVSTPTGRYIRANADWLAACTYGVGIHWTAKSTPRSGPPVPFPNAVDQFDVDHFANTIAETGADYVLFTCTHALQMLPAPHPDIESILPGRTCRRDLIGEIATRLRERNIHFIAYYNHSCNHPDDPEWEQAVGYHDPDKNRLAENLCQIVAWMGGHYGDLIRAWWFDSSYSLDPRGPYNAVTTDMTGFQFPWERFTAAAKTGCPARLVTYNAGINATYLYTAHQDYWAGELTDLQHPPTGRFLDSGLQWHGWTCLDEKSWVHSQLDTEIPNVLYTDEQIFSFVRLCQKQRAPMTFNLSIYQDGIFAPDSIRQLQTLKNNIKG